MSFPRLKLLFALIFAVIILLILYFFFSRGFPTQDESWFLQAGLRAYQGEVVYKDFQFIYHPAGVYLNVLAFSLFGISVWASRILALLNAALAIIFLTLISKHLKFSFFNTVILVLMYLFWGPGHLNFVWPVTFCITAAIVTGWAFSHLQENQKRDYILLFFTGIIAGLTLLFKQNFGVAIGAANICFFLLIKELRHKKTFIICGSGLLLPLFFQTLVIWKTNSLSWYLNDTRYLLFERIFLGGVLNSSYPWQYPAPFFYQLLKALLYFSPLIIFVVSFFKSFKSENKKLSYFPLVGLFYYGLSIRPTTDIVHLAPLLALAGISLALILNQTSQRSFKILFSLVMGALIILGGYTAFFSNYYRWDPSLVKQAYFFNHPRFQIRTDQSAQLNMNDLQDYFQREAPNEKYIFVYNYAPILYLLLNKQNPTRYDYLHPGVLNSSIENEVIHNLQKKQVRHVVTNIGIEIDPSQIAQFIRSHYSAIRVVNNYTVWQLN